jgi:hypothetical protein
LWLSRVVFSRSRSKRHLLPVASCETTTNLVQLSIIATDKECEDLTTDDFVILDYGHPQNIAFYRKERNQLPAHAPAAAAH